MGTSAETAPSSIQERFLQLDRLERDLLVSAYHRCSAPSAYWQILVESSPNWVMVANEWALLRCSSPAGLGEDETSVSAAAHIAAAAHCALLLPPGNEEAVAALTRPWRQFEEVAASRGTPVFECFRGLLEEGHDAPFSELLDTARSLLAS